MFKPSTDSANLLVNIEKIFFLFLVWRLLGGTSQVGAFLRFIGHLYLALGPNQLTRYFGSSFFSETKQKYASLMPLNGFLACL